MKGLPLSEPGARPCLPPLFLEEPRLSIVPRRREPDWLAAQVGRRCLVCLDGYTRLEEARRRGVVDVWHDDLGEKVGQVASSEDRKRLVALVDEAEEDGERELYVVIEGLADDLLEARWETAEDRKRSGWPGPGDTVGWVRRH